MTAGFDDLQFGWVQLAAGDAQGALEYADTELEHEPQSLSALWLRCRALCELASYSAALDTFRLAYQLWRSEEEHDTLPYFSADFRPEELLDMLNFMQGHITLATEDLIIRAELEEELGDYDQAQYTLMALLQTDSQSMEAWELLADVLSYSDIDAANEALGHALALDPDHPPLHALQGFIHYHRRRYRAAIAEYRQAMRNMPLTPDNFELLVFAHLKLDERAAALELVKSLTEGLPNDVSAHQFAVEIALDCEDTTLANKFTTHLLRMEPSSPATYSYHAWVDIRNGNWDTAKRILHLGFHKAVDGPYALYDLVDLLLDDGNIEDALRVAEYAVELSPIDPEAHVAHGKALRELGAYDSALEAMQRAAMLDPDDLIYTTWVGIGWDNTGHPEKAIIIYDDVLTTRPDDVWTLSNRGLAYLSMRDGLLAEVDFTDAIAQDAQYGALFFWRACAHCLQLDYEEAEIDLCRALDLDDEIQHWLQHEPLLDSMRADQRFAELFHQVESEPGT